MLVSGLLYFGVRLFLLQLYPAYTCFKAIKAKDQQQQRSFVPLLVYWITATAFLIAEYFSDTFLFWIPFYIEIKLLLVLWITLPQTKGAMVVYADVIEPFLIRHEQQIDKALVEIQSSTRRTIAVYGKQLALFIGGLIKQLVRKGQAWLTEEETVAKPDEQSSSSSNGGRGGGGWEPYSIYTALITRGAQLSDRFQSANNGAGNEGANEEEEVKLERSESYDSLSSFRSTKARNNIPEESPSGSAEKASWGAYLGGFFWSYGNNNRHPAAAAAAAGDHEKTD